jgi:hypothetical protein
MKIYQNSFEILKELSDKMKSEEFKGRIADGGINLIFLMSMIANGGDGDHVEIGTLFGGSAIAAALIKKKLGLSGDIYCIDPFDAEARSADIRLVKGPDAQTMEDQSLLNATAKDVRENAKLFDVRLKLIEKPSDPWPEELKDNVFTTAYVDGDHLRDMPHKDYLNLKDRVSDYIGFDNYEEGYPDVIGGVNKAIQDGEDWVLFYKNASFVALRRRLPPRSAGIQSPGVSL